jgi:phage/plasmid-like protein (TIGR03299 family)
MHMSDNIETAVFGSAGAGWTGKGIGIPKEIRKEPDKIAALCCPWTVKSETLFRKMVSEAGEIWYKEVPGYAGQFRSDNGKALSVTSDDRYHLTNRQPVHIFEAFRDALAANEMEITHGCSLRGGRIIVVCAEVPGEMRVGNDILRPYITLATGYDKQHGTKALTGTIRVVCNNTYDAAVGEAGRDGYLRSIRASTEILNPRELVQLVERARAGGALVVEQFNKMAATEMTPRQLVTFFGEVLEIDISKLGVTRPDGSSILSTRAENAVRALTDAYTNAPGAVRGTKWGAFNAVTFYATHVKTVRDTAGDGSDAARVASNMFGDAAALKARAYKLLTQVKVAA